MTINCVFCNDSHVRLNTSIMRVEKCRRCPPRKRQQKREEVVNLEFKYADRRRTGKTAKDHGSGAWSSRFANRSQRVSWQQGAKSNAGWALGQSYPA